MFFKRKPKQEMEECEIEEKKMLKLQAFKEFLSDAGEQRSLWIGFYSAWYKVVREKLPDYLQKDIENEFHYYTLGFFIGRMIQAILVICGVSIRM